MQWLVTLYPLFRDYNPPGKVKDPTAREAHSPAPVTFMPTAGKAETTQTMPSYMILNRRGKSIGWIKKIDRKYARLLWTILQS